MIRRNVFVFGVVFSAGTAIAGVPKPKPIIKVTPGVPMRAADIKPYVPPKIPPEPPLDASDVKTVQVTVPEINIMMRPWSSPLVGNAIEGARIPVRGTVTNKKTCSGTWYALEPFGWACSREVKPTTEPASTEPVLKVKEGERLPFQYVMALIKEGDKIPMWGSLEDMKSGREPERQIEKGDTVAVQRSYKGDDQNYWISVEGKVLPQKGMTPMGQASAWHGLDLDDVNITLPLGWVTPPKLKAYAAPIDAKDKTTLPIVELERRTRLKLLDEQMLGKKRWLKVIVTAPPPAEKGAVFGKDTVTAPTPTPVAAATPDPAAPIAPPAPSELWVPADSINEARLLAKPKTIPTDVTRWIDVDLGEQVLVIYEGDKPVFTTLVSSGRAIPTPMGTYPVWAKAAAITMKNQPYEDKGYFVNKVPWSTFFQWHNAIHGAYWHDQFGVIKSHGCVNVSPLDARHVFEWVTPALPPGWSGLRPLELLASPHVVVRNSHIKNEFRQDRPVGPPDRALEEQRLVDAEKRRADDAAAALTPAPTAPAPTPSPTAPPQ